MKTELVVQELKAAHSELDRLWYLRREIHDTDSKSWRVALSRLRFAIAALEAKENDTVRIQER
jgi:hypothetical protein